jgi:circadian clock protein KaiC
MNDSRRNEPARLPSGSDRLDAVLGGGLPRHGIILLIGQPGSGKTILAQQYAFHNATLESPAVYLSTVSEPLEKILRYGQSLRYFDPAALGRSVLYEDLGQIINDDGLPGVLARLTEVLQRRRPGVLVIDSFKALQVYAGDPGDYRRFLHEVAGRLSATPTTTFWVGEYEDVRPSDAPEFAVADAIVALGTHRDSARETRFLQVLKLRGSNFLSGAHAYRLSPAGLDVFPRLADPLNTAGYEQDSERISSGIEALDAMLTDGYWRGASTLVAGPSGAGKTLLGLHFVYAGAQRGETGVIATFQENPVQLERILRGFSWSIDDPSVKLMYRTPNDLYLDEWVYDLLATVERTGARRVLIDSLGDLRASSSDEQRFLEYVYSILQRFARAHVSALFTQEVPELFGITRISEYGVSRLSDNVLLLQFLRGDSEIKRAMTVLKTRGSAHQQQIREFEITPAGITLGSRFQGDLSLS